MSEPAAKSSADRRKRDDDAPEDQSASASDGRWHQRFKRSLKAKLDKLLATLGSLRGRLKFRSHDKGELEDGSRVEAPAMAQATPPRRRLRRFLMVLGLILPTLGLGVGISYGLLAKSLKEQARIIESQRQEIAASQLQEQGQATKLADHLKKFESEQKKCLEAEKQLSEIAQKAPDAKTCVAEPIKPQQDKPQRLKENGSKSLRPSSSSTFSPPKLLDCNLVASDPDGLKRCLDSLKR